MANLSFQNLNLKSSIGTGTLVHLLKLFLALNKKKFRFKWLLKYFIK